MVVELTKSNLSLAETLLAPLAAFQPMCTAVLTGAYPGRVFLDNLSSPRVAFLSTSLDPQGVWCFLAGDAEQDEFRHQLHRILHQRTVIGKDTTDIIFTSWPDDWQDHLQEIFDPWEVAPFPAAITLPSDWISTGKASCFPPISWFLLMHYFEKKDGFYPNRCKKLCGNGKHILSVAISDSSWQKEKTCAPSPYGIFAVLGNGELVTYHSLQKKELIRRLRKQHFQDSREMEGLH